MADPAEPRAAGSPDDGRLSFDEALSAVRAGGDSCAFAAVPVFGDDGEVAEGARVFVLQGDGAGGYQVRFVAGPFFSAALAADETMAADRIPERVRELRFLASRCREDWFSDQIQVLIGRLTAAAPVSTPTMPDYRNAAARAAAPEVRFPVAMIGRADASKSGP
jgi:hypothetical protein